MLVEAVSSAIADVGSIPTVSTLTSAESQIRALLREERVKVRILTSLGS
jgi:hypothetical protein